jgi:succinate dehydrogenase/fumarate reductase flavoprotein subunit
MSKGRSDESHRPSEPIRLRDVTRFHREADVVVVGQGAAGACAALEADAAGARVLALERTSGGGGASALSGGLIYLGGGTPVQQAAGFEDTESEMFKFLLAASQPGAHEDKIRRYCEGSVEHFHWLEAQGVPFKRTFCEEPGLEPRSDDCLVYSAGENCHPWNAIAQPAPRGHKPRVQGRGGGLLMRCLLEAVGRSGVSVQNDTRAETLVVDDDGVVAGLMARSFGDECFVRARQGVVLSAGGFIMNPGMRALHAPQLDLVTDPNGTDGDDGSGIRMGQGAGGDTLRMDLGEVALPYTIPNALSRGVYVNGRGQRFINEDTYYGHIGIEGLFHQAGDVFLLLDDETFRRGLVRMEPSWVAETIEDLEREAGFPPGALVATMEYYNRHAARGEDPLFHKRAERLVPLETSPFALVDCRIGSAIWSGFTLGGLRTSIEGEVLSPDGVVVPGLYAAGRTAALFSGHGYPGSGASLGDASFFGRCAGRAIARSSFH